MAALVGALALAAFTAPVAEAADTGITVSETVVNSGRPIIVGTTAEKLPGVSFHMAWPSGHSLSDVEASPFLHHDTTVSKGADHGGIHMRSLTCYEDGSRAANCDHVDVRYRWADRRRKLSR
ncbi:hypothetical protein [Streptomyces sp. NPDC058092]|uniref:hypothetical protein n=1 Tax=Streptomyces sp. NPDC058092 TaxID=3346336 RepID=UPI0036F08A5C